MQNLNLGIVKFSLERKESEKEIKKNPEFTRELIFRECHNSSILPMGEGTALFLFLFFFSDLDFETGLTVCSRLTSNFQ